ncbi:hypothetical protein [Undibacterium luofuense]|uniref:hypothetical protein n=1 Tax=Undibacterium luofuense TaxID=2828733 RepID=UPI0030ED705A
MHKYYFPVCTVEGDIEPSVSFIHMGLTGAVPNKCSSCKNLFEGGCTRYSELTNRYLHLDYGPCIINGPTDPVFYEDKFLKAKVEVPRKCSMCSHLKIGPRYGFYCSLDQEKWGAFNRGLDWGTWEPESVYLQLPLPKVTTKALSDFVRKNEIIKFISEYRRVNPGLSISEAKNDFSRLQNMLK